MSGFDRWVETTGAEQKLIAYGDNLQIDNAWSLIADGVAQAAGCFHHTQQSYKYPPSTETQRLREEVAHCWQKRGEVARTIRLKHHCNESLISVLRSWLWTVRQCRKDKQLAVARRCDRTWWREHWISLLHDALARRRYRRAWFFARKIAGTGIVKKTSFLF